MAISIGSTRRRGRRRCRAAAAAGLVGALALGLVAGPGVTDPAAAGPTRVAGSPNQDPVATADSFTAATGVARVVAAPGVLANDTDADGDALTASIVTGASNGELSLQPDGSFTYTSAPTFTGTDTFAYRAFDGTELSETVLVTIEVRSTTTAFVTAVYGDFLARTPDPSGLAFWVSRLDRGVESREFFLLRMSVSHEYAVKVVDRAYREVLARAVDPSGREFWARRVQGGMSVARLVVQLIASNEFVVKSGGTTGGFVDRAYEAILDRQPTAQERATQVARLDAGGRRQKLVADLRNSLESRERRVRTQYLDLLDRQPTPAELEQRANQLKTASDLGLARLLANSTEYLEDAYQA